MTWPFPFPAPKQEESRGYDYCAKHGDLSRRHANSGWYMQIGGLPVHKPICLYCYGEWLESMFPVERRTE